MFYYIINSRKFRYKRAVIIYLLVISYMVTFNSCMTTKNFSVTPDSLDSASIHEISKIKLKDGTSIDCEDKIIKLKKEADSTLLFDISSYTVGDNYQTYWTKKQIAAKDILKIQLEKSEANTDATVVLVIICGAVLALIIAVGSAMNDFVGFKSGH